MQTFLHRLTMQGVLLAGITVAMTSCVDHDYDLSKDVDLTIAVGGDLGLPSSSTENYTLGQILDLSPTSSIRPDGAQYGLSDGDYVLVQEGTRTSSTVNIPRQSITDVNCTPTTLTFPVMKPAGTDRIDLDNGLNISTRIAFSDNNIDPAVVAISSAETNVKVNLALSMTSTGAVGSVILRNGFTIEFPQACTLKAGDEALDQVCTVSGNKIVFKTDYAIRINAQFSLPVVISNIDMTKLPQGQGLYAQGHFKFDNSITYSGPVSVDVSGMPENQTANITLTVSPSIPVAELLSVTGKVNPQINVSPSSFAISDIPDFLREPGNNLDIENPQIYLTVRNTSNCEINLNACLTATADNGKTTQVWLGKDHGTAAITVHPYSSVTDGVTRICLSATGQGNAAADEFVAVPGLPGLIETIPHTITLDNIDVKVSQDRDVTFELGTYSFDVDYKVVVPLAFGSELEFNYTTDEAGWDEDLSKYSFKQVVATISVLNTTPLDMTPEVTPIDRQGNPVSDITATVEGVALAGSLASPKESQLVVNIVSNARNIGNLDGIRFRFHATCGNSTVGVALNEKQSLRFTEIKLKLKGGVGIDLN